MGWGAELAAFCIFNRFRMAFKQICGIRPQKQVGVMPPSSSVFGSFLSGCPTPFERLGRERPQDGLKSLQFDYHPEPDGHTRQKPDSVHPVYEARR